jgi:hypothetical protein
MRVVAWLMLLEALVNIVSGAVYLFKPLWLLGFLAHPEHHLPSELEVWGMFGTVVISQSVVLLGGAVARGPGAAAQRRWAYYTLVVGELLLVPFASLYVNHFGVWNASALGFVVTMAVLCVLRLYALFFAHPNVFSD